MKKILGIIGIFIVAVMVAISVSAFIGRSPDSSYIAQQREWFGSIALKMAIIRLVVLTTLWFLATFTYIEKTASYFRTNNSVVERSRFRLLFWYFAFELVFIMAYLR